MACSVIIGSKPVSTKVVYHLFHVIIHPSNLLHSYLLQLYQWRAIQGCSAFPSHPRAHHFLGGVYPRASSKNMPRTPHLGGAQEVPFNEQRQLYSEPLWIYPSSSLYLQVRTLEEVLPLVSQFFQSLLITRGHR